MIDYGWATAQGGKASYCMSAEHHDARKGDPLGKSYRLSALR